MQGFKFCIGVKDAPAMFWNSPFFLYGGDTLFLTSCCEIEMCNLAESLNI